MPCWVVPAVAAEFWGVSVEQVLADVAAGRVATQREGGLLFVAVGPPVGADFPAPAHALSHAEVWPRRSAGRRSLAWASPATQPVVTAAERDALLLIDDAAAVAAAGAIEIATAEADCCEPPGESRDKPADLPESVHDDGEPAPLPDGPEDVPAPVSVIEEPPQWASVRSRVARTRRPPPPRARDAA